MNKFEDLTQHEVEALKQDFNYANARMYQSQSPSQMKIVQQLPELWLEAEQTKQEILNRRFTEAFYRMRGLESALNPNNIMLHYAASIATIHVANYLMKKGLSVSLIEPCFDSLYKILFDFKIPLHPLREDLLYEADQIYDNLKSHVKGDAIFLVDPNNPTGFTMLGLKNRQSFEDIIRFCKDYDKILIIDHCFANFLMGDEAFELYDTYQLLRDSGIKYIAIEDTGKTWPIQDAKVAMLKVSDHLYEEMYSIYTAYLLNISPFILNVLTQYVLDAQQNQFYLTRNLLEKNRMILWETLQDTFLELQQPMAKVSVAWCQIKYPNMTATQLQKIFYENGVYVLPGTYFYWHKPEEGEQYIRVALARNTDNFFQGMKILKKTLYQKGCLLK
ncbi:MAG: pyridoxal phosphate-dependent aminotransferase [Nostocaceae cyanobacterium]|nr:pyridoxal phosphate-dependent aminotransferase [Nostocaceae cyanobacterium]